MTAAFLRRFVSLSACPGLALGICFEPTAAQQPKGDPTTEFINDYLAKSWMKNGLTPAELTGDEEFIRRVSLDIVGRVATPDEVRTFLKDTSADKRSKLVDRLLASEEYARHWAGLWTNWLLPRSGTSFAQRRALYGWLTKQLTPAKQSYKGLVETLIAASGKSDSEPAVNFALAHLGKEFPADKRADEGQ